jgi:hypothetical protein
MNRLYPILGPCLLSALPVVAAQAAPAPADTAVDVCRKLVHEAREVNRLLRTVSDKESGISAAGELRTRMEYMRRATEQLGTLPLESGEDIRTLEQLMRDLTHITQGYIPVVQRLEEVNAYGADELISLFQYYKMSAQVSTSHAQPIETPLERAYSDWCDAIDDMLYQLRRIQNQATASLVAGELPAAQKKAAEKAGHVDFLQAGLSPQQIESERTHAERLQRLRKELREEINRISNQGYFQSESLQKQLPACVQAARA